jgi:hypothetical protein
MLLGDQALDPGRDAVVAHDVIVFPSPTIPNTTAAMKWR